ncbi:HlyD family efflux transporter periplasmic adaptor subunit [Maricaulis sp. D1M11]|uniref:HlyD family efflux transporter periplasmic adaptor subunit n=1 Tax=Maricaulis sp. D1M11 TaxID=3076117 RepID=UPI0039B46891
MFHKKTSFYTLNQIFRPEAVRHATRRLGGDVVIAIPLSNRLLSALALSILLTGALFLSFATYARKETVGGWLTPESGVIRASAFRGGIVEAIYVEEGDVIDAGAPIAQIRLSSDIQDGDAGRALLAALSQQAVAAASAADAEIGRLRGEEQRLRAEIDGIERELETLREQVALQRDRVEIARQQVEQAESIAARGFLSNRELLARREALLAARQDVSRLEAALVRLERQKSDAQSAREAIPLAISSAEANAIAARGAMNERVTTTRSDSAYLVSAPAPVRVAAIPVQRGRSLAARDTVAVLVPADEELIAELFVPSNAAGFVREGQVVQLRYDAFPHERFGVGTGHIETVSSTVLTLEELSIPGLRFDAPVVRARARIDRSIIEAYGQEIPLQPGLLFSAEIVIDERSLIEWLFDPLFAAGRS